MSLHSMSISSSDSSSRSPFLLSPARLSTGFPCENQIQASRRQSIELWIRAGFNCGERMHTVGVRLKISPRDDVHGVHVYGSWCPMWKGPVFGALLHAGELAVGIFVRVRCLLTLGWRRGKKGRARRSIHDPTRV
jgi:hypothetical protein